MSSRQRSIKVGGFVLAAIGLATAAIFVIGDNRRLWDPKVTFHTYFTDVSGLKTGSGVRMGGIDVGIVTGVHYSHNAADPQIDVQFTVARNEAPRVRGDTRAKIVAKGLLGDKMIELNSGSVAQPELPDGAMVQSEADSGDLSGTLAQVKEIAKKANLTMDALQKTSEQLADPQIAAELKGSLASLHQVLDGVAHADGVIHRMIFDPEEGRRWGRISEHLDAVAVNLDGASAAAKDIMDHAKTSPGLAHTLVYDQGFAESTAGTLLELHGLLRNVRQGKSLVHTLLYGDEHDSSAHVMANVGAMTDDLRDVIRDLKRGRGTLGALLVDPSIYEDVKQMVGTVGRNEVLRALVRYSIKQNDASPSPPTTGAH